MKIERRPPSKVMRLSRLGSLHQCRLSFMRQLTRRMASESWEFSRPKFDINADGVGVAVYSAKAPDRVYSLIAFAHDLPDSLRSDRVIAEAWDATFTLFDGVPSDEDIERLSKNVPVQEAGRVSEKELTLSRANRSVRLWKHVVDALSNGRQPDTDLIASVGYLMRTTAVYGSGKFGAADRSEIADRPEFQAPFQVEMLTVYLIRTFVRDLVQHMAKSQNKDALDLDPAIANSLGIGNSTGLGMAPFIVNHPVLFNNWIIVREEALARVRNVESAKSEAIATFVKLWSNSKKMIANWTSEHPIQIEKLRILSKDIADFDKQLAMFDFDSKRPWNSLIQKAEDYSEELQELMASLVLEPYPDLVDGLASCMSDPLQDNFVIDGQMPISEVTQLIQKSFPWASQVNWTDPENQARVWYTSEEKLEPRLGERFEEPIEPYEQPLAPARDAAFALADLDQVDSNQPIAIFLRDHPQHRQAVRRAQLSTIAPYGEIQDNTVSSDLKPIDMLRAKLSFFGATQFDPRSDRWVRICMYAGAPYPNDLTTQNADLWVYPGATA